MRLRSRGPLRRADIAEVLARGPRLGWSPFRRRFRPGQVVEIFTRRPTWLLEVHGDTLFGIDLFTGEYHGLSIEHGDARVLTPRQVAQRLRLRDQIIDARERITASNGEDTAAWDALGLDDDDLD